MTIPAAAAEWIGRHRRIWQDRHDRLDEHLANLRGDPDNRERPT